MKKFLQIVCLLFSLYTRAQQDPVDSLNKALSIANTDSAKYLLYMGFYYQYYIEGNIDSAIYAADQMQFFAKKNNKKPDEAMALAFHGSQFFNENKFSDAYKILQLALKMANDPANEQPSWFAIWHNHAYDGRQSRLYVLSAIDLIFGHLIGKVDVSVQASYYRQTIKLSNETGDTSMRYIAYLNLGGIYLSLGKLDSALIFEQTAEQLTSEANDEKYKALILGYMGEIYFAKGKPDEARRQFYNSISIAKKQKDLTDIAYNYFDLTKVFLQQSNADSAYYYAVKTIQGIAGLHARFGGEILNAGTAYRNLASSYKLRNQLDSAYKYEHLASAIIDSLYRSRNKSVQEFEGLSFKDQIRLQELETEKIQTQSKIRTYALLAGTAIILLITFIVYRNNRKTQKAYGLLQKQKAETDLQKDKTDKALIELKSTQAQLIQNEKMASLGELTAGIAHEIQNPLNFVNNFSEVNKELIDELKTELTTGNQQRAIEIAQDIKDNEEKINHHGKRADAIVKGMLQHSRKNSGIKEPTDLNALCEEYVRLAYHGMRAKDNSFNVTLNTDYDEGIGIVQIIPQDIGRVILNLTNNAFYAVSEKRPAFAKATADEEYEPTVSIQTEKKNDNVEITVTDNGNGIPPKVLDKIFQPFFTTKPTGQGTGLGLSLAYDIVKVHGGELRVENKEGEFAKFIIQLPTH